MSKAIAADSRHSRVTTLVTTPIRERLFPGWSMGFRDAEHLPPADRDGASDFLKSAFDAKTEPVPPGSILSLLHGFRQTMR